MAKKIAKLSKPIDVSEGSLGLVIQNIHDKINELIVSVNSGVAKTVPSNTSGSNNDIKIVDDQVSGKAKIAVKVNDAWHTVETTEE
jgi:hypothetical protein